MYDCRIHQQNNALMFAERVYSEVEENQELNVFCKHDIHALIK